MALELACYRVPPVRTDRRRQSLLRIRFDQESLELALRRAIPLRSLDRGAASAAL